MKLDRDIGLCITQGVPLAYVQTADQPNTERAIVDAAVASANARGQDAPPIFRIDMAWGIEPLNEPAKEQLKIVLGKYPPKIFQDPFAAAKGLMPGTDNGQPFGAPPDAVVIWWAADQAWNAQQGAVAVALLRARDPLASGPAALVVGMGASTDLPALIASDVFVMHAPLPGEAERAKRLEALAADNQVDLDPGTLTQAAGLGCGLTPFQLEQSGALACANETFDLDVMGTRAREMLGSLPGVKVDVPEPAKYFGGLPWLVTFAKELCADVPLRLVVLLDECEKMLPKSGAAGGGNDGGSSSGMYSEVLKHLVDRRECTSLGVSVTGIPGTGKSTFARVLAAIANCLIVTVDVSAMANMYVGESKRNAVRTFNTLRAFGGTHLWVCTSNRTHDDTGLALFNEEWISRMTLGTVFHDAPTDDQLVSIWEAQLLKGGRKPTERYAQSTGWTGRDIANVVELANLRRCPIERVAKDHVPALLTMRAEVDTRRKIAASNCYRDAATGRPYVIPTATVTVGATGPRKMRGQSPAPANVPPAPSQEETF